MEIYIRFNSQEEREQIEATQTNAFLRDESIGNIRFLVYDDGLDAPFTIPDEVVKAAFLEMLSLVNALNAVASIQTVSPAEFLTGVKSRL